MIYDLRYSRKASCVSVLLVTVVLLHYSEACQDQQWCSSLTSFCNRSDIIKDMENLCPIACGYCNMTTDDNYTTWSDWSHCSTSCGEGYQTRFRKCNSTSFCKSDEHGKNLVQNRKCEEAPCGIWQPWQSWSECSSTCGNGIQRRDRLCSGGRCRGKYFASRSCNEEPCPIWSEWTTWSKCSVTCGNGIKTRLRSCIGGKPGLDCHGHESEEMTCTMTPCVKPNICRNLKPWCQNYHHDWCKTWYFVKDCQKYCGKC